MKDAGCSDVDADVFRCSFFEGADEFFDGVAEGFIGAFYEKNVMADALLFFVRYCGVAPDGFVAFKSFYDSPDLLA